MKSKCTFHRLAMTVLAVLILGMLPAASSAGSPQFVDVGSHAGSLTQVAAGKPAPGDKVDAFKARLEADGFIVQEGALLLAPMPYECCKQQPPIPCSFFNQASPYQAAYLPYSPHRPAGTTEIDYLRYPDADLKDLTAVWRLQPDEAVVFVGLTPPPVRYFGLQTYLFLTVGEDGSRTRKWNNFGDQENQLTIHTMGTPNGTKGDPFNSLTIRITTADRGVDAKVRAAARRAGYPPSIMNTEPVLQALLRMGVDEDGDYFSYIMRAAMPLDGYADDLDAYKQDAPVRIFRVTPKDPPPVYPAPSPDPFTVPQFRIHGTGQTEFNLLPSVRELRKKILQEYSSFEAKEYASEQWLFYGLHHMDLNDDGIGPSTDALYLKLKEDLPPLSDDDFIIVYGANHQKTGKAMYMNVSLYGMTRQITPGDVDDRQLAGSADAWLPGNPDASDLYVYKFARHCGADEQYCFEVPEGCCGNEDPEWDKWLQPGLGGVKLDERVRMVWRNYLDPTAKTGADPNEVILDKAIRFSPKD